MIRPPVTQAVFKEESYIKVLMISNVKLGHLMEVIDGPVQCFGYVLVVVPILISSIFVAAHYKFGTSLDFLIF